MKIKTDFEIAIMEMEKSRMEYWNRETENKLQELYREHARTKIAEIEAAKPVTLADYCK